MDNIAHTLTGLMMSRAGLDRVSPRATALLLIAANAPDVDIVSGLWGPLAYLDHHRGITHALAAMPLVALLPVLLVRFVTRSPLPWLRAWLVALAGVLGHLLMDWTNVYGIRLLEPFSRAWLRLDITPVVDVWIWAVLLAAIAAPALGRLVSAEIGAKPGRGRGFAICALLFLIGYSALRYQLHGQAIQALNSRIYEGETPRRVTALPHPFQPLRWSGVVETGSAIRLLPVDLTRTFDPAAGVALYPPDPSPALSAARGTDAFRRFLQFSQLPYWELTPRDDPAGGVEVVCADLRFGPPAERRFAAIALAGPNGQIEKAWFSFGPMNPLGPAQPK